MSSIHVCPLSQVSATLRASRAAWTISLLARTHRLPNFDPIEQRRRLHLAVSDISQVTSDHVLANRTHIDCLLAFVDRWDRAAPLLVHCYAGVSRSTAAAFIALCHLEPRIDENVHARRLRAASPTATPNPHLVALADAVLERRGRMTAAVAAIGRGADCYEGAPFALPLAAAGNAEPVLDAPRPQPA